ncbi:interferon regulatory factor 6-like isoform X2 [Syngnathus acus]|uniref:interferon regulatory factor 6-like isoform X2 n=1 Tax=Syngnathus acus TaxID=161584 RepID=UPI00188627F7|nr:interferon regulatory factor 6-like isoform X2 [Syngnathus acus]
MTDDRPPSLPCEIMSAQGRRVRLKPWLVAQVDSGRFPGLHWVDWERRLFQIPWKHAARSLPTTHQEESSIFKAWALETGKFQEGVDEADPAKWKANLRCALNKSKEFRLHFDGTKETPLQAYKIYQLVDSGQVLLCSRLPFSMSFLRAPGRLPSFFNLLFAYFRLLFSTLPLLSDAAAAADEMPNVTELTIDAGICRPASSVSVLPPHGDANRFRVSAVASELPRQDFQIFDEVDRPEVSNEVRAQVDSANLLASIPSTDLDLKFQYRGRSVGSLTVSSPQGCRLFYGQLGPDPRQVDLFGPVDLQQVSFPGTSEILSQKQRQFTEALLSVMDRGLILEIWEQDIYAVRLCQCKVYWSGPGAPHQGGPNQLERERRVKVFSLNDFLQGLILYQKGEAGNSPPYEICFCFGEDWPDDQKPKEKKLIVVQVVPVVARILTEMFSGEHSWSIDSIRLQISNPDVKDQTVEQFKELQRLLQSQNLQGP